MSKFLVLSLIVIGCGSSKPQAPRTHVPDNAGDQLPGMPGAQLDLTCEALSKSTTVQTAPFKLRGKHTSACSANRNDLLSLLVTENSDGTGNTISLKLAGFHGADHFDIDADDRAEEKISFLGNSNGQGMSATTVHADGCTPSCKVIVSDIPNRPTGYRFDVQCDSLCGRTDAYKCKRTDEKPIEFHLLADCRNVTPAP